MKNDIDKLTEEELIDLNHRVVGRLRLLAQMRTHGAMMRLSIGKSVTFDSGDGTRVIGVLTKYNKKTVTVITEDGHRWNVSPGLLREAEPKNITPKKGNTVQLKSSG